MALVLARISALRLCISASASSLETKESVQPDVETAGDDCAKDGCPVLARNSASARDAGMVRTCRITQRRPTRSLCFERLQRPSRRERERVATRSAGFSPVRPGRPLATRSGHSATGVRRRGRAGGCASAKRDGATRAPTSGTRCRRSRRRFGGAKPPGGKCPGAGERGEGGVARLHVDVNAVGYLLDFARAPPDTITDSAALSLPEAV